MERRSLERAGIALGLLLITALGTGLRVEASQSRYKAHRHQPFDVHRYYVSPAESFLAGNGWETDYDQNFIPPPLQGVFVAIAKTVAPTASYGGLRRAQAWIGAVAILLAFWIGWEIGGRWVGLLAAAFFALDPDVVKAAESLLTETHYFVLLFGFLAVLLCALRTGKLWLFGATGALLGLTSLMKPFPLLLAVLLPAYFYARERSTASLVRGALLLALFALTLSPWIARNFIRYEAIYPISTNGGTLLAMGNHLGLDSHETVYWEQIQKTPMWHSRDIEAEFRGQRDADGKLMWNEKDAAYQRYALRYIIDHPLHFARNYAIKLYNVFRHPLGEQGGPWRIRHFYRVTLIMLGFLGLAGFAVTQRANPSWVLVWTVGYFAAFTALFHITRSGRINLPVKVLLGFFAAWVLVVAARAALTRADAGGGLGVHD